ncbi:MAG: NFYB/HAP3 family transcription factor subunit [Candidatus Woesearchaeota archaeon]
MPKNKSIIPKANVERLMKNSGAIRVSNKALEEITDFLTKKGFEISKRAVEIAKNSGRRTVLARDVKLAFKF